MTQEQIEGQTKTIPYLPFIRPGNPSHNPSLNAGIKYYVEKGIPQGSIIKGKHPNATPGTPLNPIFKTS